jgi:hypothetical protein
MSLIALAVIGVFIFTIYDEFTGPGGSSGSDDA